MDALETLAVYLALVRARSLLRRHAVDALIVAFAAFAVAEAAFAPSQRPRSATLPLALLWTLPLLFRRGFPLAAPVAVFVVLAAEALAVNDVVTDAQITGFAILVAFAAAGGHPDVRAALAGALVGYASIAVILLDDRPGAAS